MYFCKAEAKVYRHLCFYLWAAQSTVQCHFLPFCWLWRYFHISAGLCKRPTDRYL